METPAAIVGIELVVPDLDRAIELFTHVLGCDLVSRSPSELVVGESAIVDANGIMISLLQPASAGDGTVLAVREPRLSQLVFMAAGDGPETAAMEAGLSVVPMTNGFHLSPESVEGALGIQVAIVVSHIDG